MNISGGSSEPSVERTPSQSGIYIHVPYCRVICPYCDFVRARRSGAAPREFANALIHEINRIESDYSIGSIFFGGGTPSMLDPEDFYRIANVLQERFNHDRVEFTIEANPDDVVPALVGAWRDAGVNRISLGVQSFDDDTLAFLGRCHDAEAALRACELVRHAFDNWSIDLIFGARVPGVGEGAAIARFEHDLEQVLAFSPPHVSAYALTIENRTPFARHPGAAVDDDLSLELYRMAHTGLAQYEHYEVSNFALPGWRSAHNQIYWRNEAYLGLGPGAVSYLGGVRSRNHPSIAGYLRAPGRKIESTALSPDEIKVETLIQHFRTRDGIATEYYSSRFGSSIEADFGSALLELRERGLVAREAGRYVPTLHGYELNDEIGLALVGSGSPT